jgi:hypothetical protein
MRLPSTTGKRNRINELRPDESFMDEEPFMYTEGKMGRKGTPWKAEH